MKTFTNTLKLFTLLTIAAGTSVGVSSCGKKGCMDELATNYDAKAKKEDPNNACTYNLDLSGEITEDKTLVTGQEYTLSGGVHVKDGVTLTIQPGVTVKSDPNEAVAYLLIERGGKIMAEGTADQPIVFTSGASVPAPGDWGGIIICGKAPINKGSESTAEVGDVLYGGSDASDNSGVLKYIRVEYGGNAINDEKEHNGFTFNGVGSGTTVEYLQAYKGNDDGFEWFGGTVNVNHLVSSGNGDDCFDWTFGWVGSGTEFYGEQELGYGDRGIEADNQSGANTATPYSNPTLSKVTLIGQGTSAGTAAVKLREGTKGNLSEFNITGFADGWNIEHDQTLANVIDGSLKVSNYTMSSVDNEIKTKDSSGASDSQAALDAKSSSNISEGSGSTGASSDWMSGWTKEL